MSPGNCIRCSVYPSTLNTVLVPRPEIQLEANGQKELQSARKGLYSVQGEHLEMFGIHTWEIRGRSRGGRVEPDA